MKEKGFWINKFMRTLALSIDEEGCWFDNTYFDLKPSMPATKTWNKNA